MNQAIDPRALLRLAFRILSTGFLALWFFVSAAVAHPHIWVDAQLFVQLDNQGRLQSLRHIWVFDPGYSSWIVQGLDVNGDGEISSPEMSELARDNIEGLSAYDFFTFAGENNQDIALQALQAPDMRYENDRVVLDYVLTPTVPVEVGEDFSVAIFDPEYYVAIDLVPNNPVVLINAPQSCGTRLIARTPLSPEVEEKLLAIGSEVTSLPPELKTGLREAADRVGIACGPNAQLESSGAVEPSDETAAEVLAEIAEPQGENEADVRREPVFSAPALQQGIPVARDGVLGWIFQRQQDFYQALTLALDGLKTDWTAIWVLGLLSFLYGVFHAAGPGHGKLVISSYVMATRVQARRGVILSFAASMLQAVVAVSFVLIAAGVLQLTSTVMSDATRGFVLGSYVLVILLGVWLVYRKLWGWLKSKILRSDDNHHHAHDHAHAHHHHDHGHDHAHQHHGHHHHDHDHGSCDHQHAVEPSDTQKPFWEQMGIIISIGMRPCSGALIVLVFALSQGILFAGIIAAFLMALGTGITVSLLAVFAISLKGVLAKMPSRPLVNALLWWVELGGAFLVLSFGLLLLLANI